MIYNFNVMIYIYNFYDPNYNHIRKIIQNINIKKAVYFRKLYNFSFIVFTLFKINTIYISHCLKFHIIYNFYYL